MAGKLSDEDIFQGLKSLNVPVRMSDISMPTRDFVIRVFECFLKDQQIDITNGSQKNFDAIKHMEQPDMYHEGTMLIQLIKYINKITRENRLEISVKDIIEPKPKRTKRILNHLIVFWNYSFQKMVAFQNFEETLKEEKRQVEEMQVHVAELQRKQEEYNKIVYRMNPSKEELASSVSSKAEKQADFSKRYKDLVNEYETVIKKKEKDLHDKITSLGINALSVKEKITEIEQLILPSPDRLTAELQRLKDVIKSEDIKIREKELQSKESKKNADSITQAWEQNVKISEVLQEIKNSLEEFIKLITQFLSGYAELEKEEEQLKKSVAELEDKDKLKNMIMEKERKISLNTLKYKESMGETLVSLKKKTENELKALESLKFRKADIAQKIDRMKNSVNQIAGYISKSENMTQAQKDECMAQMELIVAAYLGDCKKIKEHAKKIFRR